MSEWDEFDPEHKRRSLLNDPVQADRLIAADNRLIAAMNKCPIDLEGLRDALKDEACPDRVIVNGLPALHVAIHKRDVKALDLLLRYAARTDDWDIEGATALDEAYRKRFTEGIKLLKLSHAEPRLCGEPGRDKPDDVFAPSYETRMQELLSKMIRYGTPRQMEQAIELGANVNPPKTGVPMWPPLHVAVYQCDPAKVQVLLKAGADVHARTTKGEEVIDVLWRASAKTLLSPDWMQVFDDLRVAGYQNLFVKHPSELTLSDLRQPLPEDSEIRGPAREHVPPPSLLHHLVRNGHADFVFEALKRDPKDQLTAKDLLTRCEKHRETLLEAFANAGALPRIFSAETWQDRLEEMLSLKPAVDKSLYMRNRVDFNKASADVRERRLQELKRKAPKLQLKR